MTNTPTGRFVLQATSAKAARNEIHWRWPKHEVDYVGFDEDGNDVFISTVKRTGDKGPVATARRNRAKPPVRFVTTRFR